LKIISPPLVAGVADWPTFFGLLGLALPTSREAIVAAKFADPCLT
jgi:hypothetical protein